MRIFDNVNDPALDDDDFGGSLALLEADALRTPPPRPRPLRRLPYGLPCWTRPRNPFSGSKPKHQHRRRVVVDAVLSRVEYLHLLLVNLFSQHAFNWDGNRKQHALLYLSQLDQQLELLFGLNLQPHPMVTDLAEELQLLHQKWQEFFVQRHPTDEQHSARFLLETVPVVLLEKDLGYVSSWPTIKPYLSLPRLYRQTMGNRRNIGMFKADQEREPRRSKRQPFVTLGSSLRQKQPKRTDPTSDHHRPNPFYRLIPCQPPCPRPCVRPTPRPMPGMWLGLLALLFLVTCSTALQSSLPEKPNYCAVMNQRTGKPYSKPDYSDFKDVPKQTLAGWPPVHYEAVSRNRTRIHYTLSACGLVITAKDLNEGSSQFSQVMNQVYRFIDSSPSQYYVSHRDVRGVAGLIYPTTASAMVIAEANRLEALYGVKEPVPEDLLLVDNLLTAETEAKKEDLKINHKPVTPGEVLMVTKDANDALLADPNSLHALLADQDNVKYLREEEGGIKVSVNRPLLEEKLPLVQKSILRVHVDRVSRASSVVYQDPDRYIWKNNSVTANELTETRRVSSYGRLASNNLLRFQAYDCSAPVNVHAATAEVRDDCNAHAIVPENARPASFTLLQSVKQRSFRARYCKMVQWQTAAYCGVYDHQTALSPFKQFGIAVLVSDAECQQWVNQLRFTDPKKKDHPLKYNATTQISFYVHGKEWHSSSGEVKCYGDTIIAQDGSSIYQVVMYRQVDIYIGDMDVHVAHDGEVSIGSYSATLDCPLTKGFCAVPGLGTFVWNAAEDGAPRCFLAKTRTINGNLVSTKEDRTVFVSNDGTMVRLEIRQPHVTCGRHIYTTNYDNLFLFSNKDYFGHRRRLHESLAKEGDTAVIADPSITTAPLEWAPLEPTDVSIITYSNNKDDFLYGQLSALLVQEVQSVLQRSCEQEVRRRQNDFGLTAAIQGAMQAGDTTRLSGGRFGTITGEVWTTYYCRSALVTARPVDHCYSSLPVILTVADKAMWQQTHDWSDDRLNRTQFFLEPFSRRITTLAAEIPCSRQFPLVYSNVHGDWISFTPEYTVVPPPEETLNVYRAVNVTAIDFQFHSEIGGIYSLDTIKETEEFLAASQRRNTLGMVFGSTMDAESVDGDEHGGITSLLPSALFDLGGFNGIWKGLKAWGFVIILALIAYGIYYFSSACCNVGMRFDTLRYKPGGWSPRRLFSTVMGPSATLWMGRRHMFNVVRPSVPTGTPLQPIIRPQETQHLLGHAAASSSSLPTSQTTYAPISGLESGSSATSTGTRRKSRAPSVPQWMESHRPRRPRLQRQQSVLPTAVDVHSSPEAEPEPDTSESVASSCSSTPSRPWSSRTSVPNSNPTPTPASSVAHSLATAQSGSRATIKGSIGQWSDTTEKKIVILRNVLGKVSRDKDRKRQEDQAKVQAKPDPGKDASKDSGKEEQNKPEAVDKDPDALYDVPPTPRAVRFTKDSAV